MVKYFEKLDEMRANLYALTLDEKVALDERNKAGKIYMDILNFGEEVAAFEYDFNPKRNLSIILEELEQNEKIEKAFLNKKETYKEAFKATAKFFLELSALGAIAVFIAGILLGYTINSDIFASIGAGFSTLGIAALGFGFIRFRAETLAFRILTHGAKLEEVQEKIKELTLEKTQEEKKIKVAKTAFDGKKEQLESVSRLVREQRDKIDEFITIIRMVVQEFLERDLTEEQQSTIEAEIDSAVSRTLGINL